jgi:hypothetical protein
MRLHYGEYSLIGNYHGLAYQQATAGWSGGDAAGAVKASDPPRTPMPRANSVIHNGLAQ